MESAAKKQLKTEIVTRTVIDEKCPTNPRDERVPAAPSDLPEAKHFERALPTIAEHTVNALAGDFFSSLVHHLVACRSEFVTTDTAGGVRVFPLKRSSIGGVGVDVASEFTSQVGN